jgi:hypothetical protein
MIASLDGSDGAPGSATWRERLVAGATVLGWLLLAGLIAASYVGHSPSPYGVCYSARGRSVPCAAVARR